MKFILFIATFLFFYSCKELTGASTGANDSIFEKVIGGIGSIEVGGGRTLLEGGMDNGGDAGHNFSIRLKVPENEQITFFFFANKALNGGIELTFKRIGTQISLLVDINGVTHQQSISIDGSGEVGFSIDIHNDHEDVHLIVWDELGPFDDSEECFFDETCLYNTESFTSPNPGPWGNQGKGAGQFWGYEGSGDYILELNGPSQARSDA